MQDVCDAFLGVLIKWLRWLDHSVHRGSEKGLASSEQQLYRSTGRSLKAKDLHSNTHSCNSDSRAMSSPLMPAHACVLHVTETLVSEQLQINVFNTNI